MRLRLDLGAVQKIHGALGVGGGREDEALVILQGLEPVGDIGGMVVADFRGDAEVGAKEGGAQFGDQLLLGVASVAPFDTAEIPVKAGRVAWVISCARVL